jgi:hypothetical protein
MAGVNGFAWRRVMGARTPLPDVYPLVGSLVRHSARPIGWRDA